jgi:hypothetical protein
VQNTKRGAKDGIKIKEAEEMDSDEDLRDGESR